MTLTSELVGKEGAYSLLCDFLEKDNVYPVSEVENFLEEKLVSDNLFSDLVKAGLITGVPTGYLLSSTGKKITLLLRAINEEDDVEFVFRELAYQYPNLRPYELITHNITDYFIDNLYTRTNFIRLSICSPWIRLEQPYLDKIKYAVMQASLNYPNLQIRVITVPLNQYNNQKAAKMTLGALKQLGAAIVTNTKLHAKLYIVEPGPLGGSHYAILGSENLTGKGNIELAIKVENDNDILKKLDQYFFDIWQNSTLLEEV